MSKKTKIFITLLLMFIFNIFIQTSSAKYVIEDIQLVAKIDIDRCKPNIELIDITSSNTNYPTYVNQNHLITGHIKITEKNIIRNDLSTNNIKVCVDNSFISPQFNSFFLVSENSTEKIYEFSFTHSIHNGSLSLIIPEGIIEDKSGLINEKKNFKTNIIVDNIPPVGTFKEISTSDGKSKAEITCNESIKSLSGWDISEHNQLLSKEFSHTISYLLPLVDFAENASNVLVSIQNATNISLEYGTYDDYVHQLLPVSGGKISAPTTISSNSICKTESLFISLTGNLPANCLQGKAYVYTYWGEGARAICLFSELSYYHGYNPTLSSNWWNIGKNNTFSLKKHIYTQFGGMGLNLADNTSSINKPIPTNIANQYLFGISGIQFKLKDISDFSVVYQSYVKDIGWLQVSSDGEENLYQHDKPISAFRINIVPKTEKQYLIDFWNRDIGTNHLD